MARSAFRASGDGGTAVVEVADTGAGITPDDVPQVFDRFFRASTAADVPGTGLGLAIAKAIVEGLTAAASSERASSGAETPSGSCCLTHLQPPPRSWTPIGSSVSESGRKLVLVADDDPDILDLVAFRLDRAGYEVVQARDGQEALDAALTRTPDLLRARRGGAAARRVRGDAPAARSRGDQGRC